MRILIHSSGQEKTYVLIPICSNFVFYGNGFYSDYHIHPVYHLVFVLKGSGFLTRDYDKLRLREKDIFVVNPNEKHIYSSDNADGMTHFTVNFYLIEKDKYESIKDKLIKNNKIDTKTAHHYAETAKLHELFDFNCSKAFVEYDKSMWDEIIHMAETFYSEVDRVLKSPYYILQGNSVCHFLLFSDHYSRFLTGFIDLISEKRLVNPDFCQFKDEVLLNKIIKYLNENIYDEFHLEDLSKALNYSPVYLCTYFKKKTGITIMQYMNKLKISKACELLRRTDKTITEIAAILNFSSSNHLSNNFKKEKGFSPTEYRKRPELQ